MEEWNKAIEAAASVVDDWGQAVLEQVNSGDNTLAEVYPELRKLERIKKDILKLKRIDT